jgi:hypothetical protein
VYVVFYCLRKPAARFGRSNPPLGLLWKPVSEAFACSAQVGTGGCGFESPLEAARWALDPARKANPGFLRPDSLLALIFVTDEDDCSAKNPKLFDPNQGGLNDPLGPLTSFRCFELGVDCQCGGGACSRTTVGVRHNCKPAVVCRDQLFPPDHYCVPDLQDCRWDSRKGPCDISEISRSR